MGLRIIPKEELEKILTLHARWLKVNKFKDPKISKTMDNKYYLDKSGRVASIFNQSGGLRTTPFEPKLRVGTSGYQIVTINRVNKLLHRVIAQEYIGSVEGKIVHHIDGNRLNNNLSNLKITDVSENNKFGAKTRAKNLIKRVNEVYNAFSEIASN